MLLLQEQVKMAKQKCPACNGEKTDGYHKDPEEACSVCNGKGEIEISESTPKKTSKKKSK